MEKRKSETAQLLDEATGSSKPSSDPDLETINVSQDFRRSKRNSLVWSSLTILATIGIPTLSADAPQGQTVVSLFQIGLGFTQLQIVLACLVAATFMLIGYVRSEAMLRLQNTELMRQKKLSEYGLVLDALVADAQFAGLEIAELERRAKTATAKVENDAKPFINGASNIREKILQLKSEAEDSNFYSQLPGQAKTLDPKKVQASLSRIHDRLSHISDEIETYPPVPAELGMKECEEVARVSTSLDESMEAISRVAETLQGFDKRIGKGQILWFRLYDKLPVYSLYLLSLVLSAVWLCA